MKSKSPKPDNEIVEKVKNLILNDIETLLAYTEKKQIPISRGITGGIENRIPNYFPDVVLAEQRIENGLNALRQEKFSPKIIGALSATYRGALSLCQQIYEGESK